MRRPYKPFQNDYKGTPERKAYAKRVGETGRAFARAIIDHCDAAARWQYVHYSLAHIEADALEHGFLPRLDDSITESENKQVRSD